jgi:hypothetical protein
LRRWIWLLSDNQFPFPLCRLCFSFLKKSIKFCSIFAQPGPIGVQILDRVLFKFNSFLLSPKIHYLYSVICLPHFKFKALSATTKEIRLQSTRRSASERFIQGYHLSTPKKGFSTYHSPHLHNHPSHPNQSASRRRQSDDSNIKTR